MNPRTNPSYSFGIFIIEKSLEKSPPTFGRGKGAVNAVLTLSTCYPFRFVGNAPKRYIVQAGLVIGDPVG